MKEAILNFWDIKNLLKEMSFEEKYSLIKNKKDIYGFKYSNVHQVLTFLRDKNNNYIKNNSESYSRKVLKDFSFESKNYMYFPDENTILFNYSELQFKETIKNASEKDLIYILLVSANTQMLDKFLITYKELQGKNIELNNDAIEKLTHSFFVKKLEWLDGRLKFDEKYLFKEESDFYEKILNTKGLESVKCKLHEILLLSKEQVIERVSPSLCRSNILGDSNDFYPQKRLEYFENYLERLKIITERNELTHIINSSDKVMDSKPKKRL